MQYQTYLEQLVVGNAVSKIAVLNDDFVGRPFDAFMQIYRHVHDGAPEPDAVCIDDCDFWDDVLEKIEREARLDLTFIRGVFDLAKEGICQSAIDGTLDSDMNQLDMVAMVELGALCASNPI